MHERDQRLSENGDPLVKDAALIDFEAFRPQLATALKRSDGSKGDRPPCDATLSDETPQCSGSAPGSRLILSVSQDMRFLGLWFEDAVPDAKKVWPIGEQHMQGRCIEALFVAFDVWLKGKCYLAISGQIIDASIIAALRKRNTEAEKGRGALHQPIGIRQRRPER